MQKVLTGTSQLSTLANYLQSNEVHRVLLLTGKHSYTASSADSILEPDLSGFQVSKFYDFSNNPKIEDVTKGIQIFRRNEDRKSVV